MLAEISLGFLSAGNDLLQRSHISACSLGCPAASLCFGQFRFHVAGQVFIGGDKPVLRVVNTTSPKSWTISAAGLWNTSSM